MASSELVQFEETMYSYSYTLYIEFKMKNTNMTRDFPKETKHMWQIHQTYMILMNETYARDMK